MVRRRLKARPTTRVGDNEEMCFRRVAVAVLVCVLGLTSTSCALSRNRNIARNNHPATQTLLTATKADLIKRVSDFYNSIQTLNIVADLTPSLGSVYAGKIVDYHDVTAYIAFKKPADIQVVALVPVVRSTLFTLVSDGKQFKLYIPPKNRFIEGSNDAPAASKNTLENIRPQTFLEALLVRPYDAATQASIMVDDTSETSSYYRLAFLRKLPNWEVEPYRRITFDRVNLQITEQREYDPEGSIVSLSRYSDWQIFDNIRFPAKIEITRPKENYGVILAITKMEINRPIPDSRFELQRPEGTELQIIGAPTPPKPETEKPPK